MIDSFSVLEAIVPTFHESLWPKFKEIFPMIILALRSRFAIIRQAAAKCFVMMIPLIKWRKVLPPSLVGLHINFVSWFVIFGALRTSSVLQPFLN